MKQIVNHLSALTILTFFLPMYKINLFLTIWKERREKKQIDQKKKDRNNEQGKKLFFGERKFGETNYFTEERPS